MNPRSSGLKVRDVYLKIYFGMSFRLFGLDVRGILLKGAETSSPVVPVVLVPAKAAAVAKSLVLVIILMNIFFLWVELRIRLRLLGLRLLFLGSGVLRKVLSGRRELFFSVSIFV